MLRCSFCQKSENEVDKLVAGPQVYICNECVAIAARLISGFSQSPTFDVADVHASAKSINRQMGGVSLRGGRLERPGLFRRLWDRLRRFRFFRLANSLPRVIE